MASGDDLEQLLDSALDDFDPVAEPSSSSPAHAATSGASNGLPALPSRAAKKKKAPPPRSGPSTAQGESEGAEQDAESEQKRMLEELASGLAQMMGDLGDDDEAQAAADQLQATIQALAAGTESGEESAQRGGDSLNEAMYGHMMEEFQSMGESPEMQAMMDKMMRHILSKDVLYQPMKEVGDKYPRWLEANRASLSAEDIDRYAKQQALIAELCTIYEERPDSFAEVVSLMQQMQECGQPPAELIQELAPDLKFGPNGLPEMSGENGLPPELANCTIQ